MKMILILLLTGFLSSCKTQSFRIEEERCVVSTEFNKCRCHQYVITEGFSGRVSESVDKELEYCDRHVSFSASAWIEILNTIENLARKSGHKTLRFESESDFLLMVNELR